MAGPVFRTEPNWNRRLKLKIRKTFRRQLVRPRGQRAAHHPASARVRLGAGPRRWVRLVREANLDGCFLARQQFRQAFRLHRLSEGNQCQVDGRGPEPRRRLLGQQAWRLHHLNGGDLDQVHDRSPV